MDVFLPQVTLLFQSPLKAPNLLSMSARLQEQFKEKLQSSKICMLPSYNHTLPTGHERGRYLAVDLGGSNLRVALVELGGKPDKEVISSVMDIVRMFTFRIDNAVRTLRGHDFFDWMAERIDEAISEPEVRAAHGDDTLPMGISWSFPVEYVTTGLIFVLSS
jgi:hexokinase